MKKIIFVLQKAVMTTVLMAGLYAGNVGAQTLVTPFSSGSVLYNGGSYVPLGVNTAMICRTNLGYPALYAYATYTSASGAFDVYDPAINFASGGVTGFSLSATPSGTPDIILGNTGGGTSGTDFIAAIAYPTTSGIRVDFKRVIDNGITITTGAAISTVTYSCNPRTVHIDIIAEYGNTSATGMPFCDKFIITWDDATSNFIYAAYGTLSGAAAGTFTITPTAIAWGKSPDVAAVERTVSSTTRNTGLITYTSLPGDTLSIRTWDASAGTVSAATVLDLVTGVDNIQIPRIDANDNKTLNAPAGATNSIYKVAAEVEISGGKVIRTYDNLMAGTGSPYWTCSGVIDLSPVTGYSAPPYMHYAPTVAFCGPAPVGGSTTDGTQYMVQHFTDEGSGTNDVVMMDPIDYTAPRLLAITASGLRKYYWVSDDAASTASTSGVYATSVSSACNNVATNSISVWAYSDISGSGDYLILYKSAPYPYGYKQAQGIASLTATHWQVYPNPATNAVTVTSPAGKGESAGYQVVDMAGRTLLSGNFSSAQQQIDLRTLPAGSYMLQLHREGGAGKNQMFVKE